LEEGKRVSPRGGSIVRGEAGFLGAWPLARESFLHISCI
jgi:hypothetical protein